MISYHAAAVSLTFSVYLGSSMSDHHCDHCDHQSQQQRDYGHEPTSFCPDGVPLDFALLSLLAAFGAAFGILYVALTQAQGRRRRSAGTGTFLVLNTELADLVWSGRTSMLPSSLELLNVFQYFKCSHIESRLPMSTVKD